MATVMQGDEPWERFPELDKFVQNRRLSYYLSQSLSEVLQTMQDFPSLGWCIRGAMLAASNRYRLVNLLKTLTVKEMHGLFADVLCATMLGSSFHSGSHSTPPP